MRLLTICGVAAATMLFQQVAPRWVAGHVPTSLAYSLPDHCVWQQRAWVLYLGNRVRPRPDAAGEAAEARCWAKHGQKSPTPFLKTVQAKWPSAEQFARWDSDDAASLHAPAGG